MSPSLSHHPLHRADGSATFSSTLYTILASVNGPVEVQRRDELPEEAAIEVNIRPFSGVGGPRERWLESVIASLLRSLLLVHMHPRTLIQVTLQVTQEPTGVRIKRGVEDVAVLPALANAAFAALVDGGLPLGETVSAGLAVVREKGRVVVEPNERELVGCRSVHAMAFTARGDMLLNQSAGVFDIGEWRGTAEELKKRAVAAIAPHSEDESMANGNTEAAPWMRQALEESVQQSRAWADAG